MPSCTSPLGFPIKEPGALRPARDARIQFVACGKCMACRLNHARNWATRITHEASLYEDNCFITLTYSNEFLPDPPEVSKREMQLFIKRLRKELEPKKVRYFLCGEYGSQTKRPHYHIILFNHAFMKERYVWRSIRGNLYYRSPLLESLWTFGTSEFSGVTPQSAGYVARYSVKKANYFTAQGDDPYTRVNAQTGEVYTVAPEFLQMSNRPGIGFSWVDKYPTDLFPSGFLILDGRKVPIPGAYRRRIMETMGHDINMAVEAADHERYLLAIENSKDDTPERRAVRDELLRLRTKNLKRDLE